jgi:hypothetical protein
MEQVMLTEKFAAPALSYILSNWDSWEFRPETDKTGTRSVLQKYLASSSDDGTRAVKYKKSVNGHGRLFAERGMSLQSMVREVRNAIAHPFYVDLDFCNCQPTLLVQKCRQRGIECPLLEHYCERRSEVLSLLSPDDPAAGKTQVLATINGGLKGRIHAERERGVDAGAVWQRRFSREMARITEKLMAPGEPDHKYMQLTKKTRNKMGSAMNIMLCDAEHEALMALKEFLESDRVNLKVGVLMFDGCLVERSPSCTQSLLDEASDYVYDKTRYRLRIVLKDMTADMLNVPLEVYSGPPLPPPRYAKEDLSAATLLLDDMSGAIVSCEFKVYVKNGIAWTDNEVAVNSLMHKTCLRSNIKHINDDGVVKEYSSMFNKASQIVKAAKSLLNDDAAFKERLWSSSIGAVCFANGLYDFRRGAFYTYEERPDVATSIYVDRDFPVERPAPEAMEEVVEKVLMSTLGDRERVRTYLEMIARATAGELQDKQWCVMLGERNSGKGLLQELNKAAWGPYVNTVNSSSMLLSSFNSSDAAKDMSWAVDCKYTRQTYTNEIKIDTSSKMNKIDGSLIKTWQSGGDTLKGRQLYDRAEEFRSASRLFMNLNDMPPVTPADALDTMVMFKFPFKFVSRAAMEGDPLPFFREADESLKGEYCKRDDVIAAFIWLVVDAYKPRMVVPCAAVREDSMAFKEDAGDDLLMMRRVFKVTKDVSDFVLLKDLNDWAAANGLSRAKLHDRLTKMGAIKNDNCRVGGVRHGRGFTKLVMMMEEGEENM